MEGGWARGAEALPPQICSHHEVVYVASNIYMNLPPSRFPPPPQIFSHYEVIFAAIVISIVYDVENYYFMYYISCPKMFIPLLFL